MERMTASESWLEVFSSLSNRPPRQLTRARLDSCCSNQLFQFLSLIVNHHLGLDDQGLLLCKPAVEEMIRVHENIRYLPVVLEILLKYPKSASYTSEFWIYLDFRCHCLNRSFLDQFQYEDWHHLA